MIKKYKKITVVLLIISILMSGCSTLFPTQRMIDDILPNNDRHYYCEADLIPYSKEELTNATLLYGQELTEYYFMNVNKYDETIVDSVDVEAKNEFMARLTYLNSNYKLLKARYEKYAKLEGATEEEYKKVDKEFNDFYKLPNSVFENVIKENNGGKLAGCPNISLKIDVKTFENHGIYYDALADVYKHVVIDNKKYEKIHIGDKITLEFPESNANKDNTNMKQVELELVATDSFIQYNAKSEQKVEDASLSYINKKSNDSIYYVTPYDPLSKNRSLINADGEVIEVYVGTEKIQIMKDARVAEGIDETRLVTQILREDSGTKNYSINDICAASLGGGYIDEIYKDNIYVNTIYTNLKGYITSMYCYKQMYIDIEYARKNGSKYTSDNASINNNSLPPMFGGMNGNNMQNNFYDNYGYDENSFPDELYDENIDSVKNENEAQSIDNIETTNE